VRIVTAPADGSRNAGRTGAERRLTTPNDAERRRTTPNDAERRRTTPDDA